MRHVKRLKRRTTWENSKKRDIIIPDLRHAQIRVFLTVATKWQEAAFGEAACEPRQSGANPLWST